MSDPITLAEQIAAVETAALRAGYLTTEMKKQAETAQKAYLGQARYQAALAAAAVTLRSLRDA